MTATQRPALALAFALACCLPAATLRAAPPAKPGPSPAMQASAAILKEYQAVMKDKKGEGLREKSDFVDNSNGALTAEQVTALTPDAVLAALEKPVPGASDPRAEAYVKWQLLSAVKGKFPDEFKARAVAVYRRAPQPTSHPGADRTALERTLNRVGITKQEAEPGINKEFGDAVARYRIHIEPILSYRDELYARLPQGFETLTAALEDVYARVSRGAPANEFWTSVSSAIRSWALTSGDAKQIAQLGKAVNKLREFVTTEKNRPYYRVMWATEDKYTGLKWMAESTIQNDKSMEDIATWLEERAKNPGGGLNFKEPEDPKKK
jgi:hypothetical protein